MPDFFLAAFFLEVFFFLDFFLVALFLEAFFLPAFFLVTFFLDAFFLESLFLPTFFFDTFLLAAFLAAVLRFVEVDLFFFAIGDYLAVVMRKILRLQQNNTLACFGHGCDRFVKKVCQKLPMIFETAIWMADTLGTDDKISYFECQ